MPSKSIKPLGNLDDKAFVAELCSEIASGKNLKKVLRSYSGNLENKFWSKMYTDESFARLISRARSAGMDSLAMETLELADEADETNYNSQKLKIWARQWLCSKLSPRYRDKGLLDATDSNAPTELIVRWGQPKDKLIKTINDLEEEPKALEQ